MTSAPAIGFEFRPSRWLQRGLCGGVALVVLAVAVCALATGWKLALMAAVLMAAWGAMRELAHAPVSAAGWGTDNVWSLHFASHEDVPATLASFRVLGPLVLLRLRTMDRGVQVLLLAPDNSDGDIRRRLRMRLATVQDDEALPRI